MKTPTRKLAGYAALVLTVGFLFIVFPILMGLTVIDVIFFGLFVVVLGLFVVGCFFWSGLLLWLLEDD